MPARYVNDRQASKLDDKRTLVGVIVGLLLNARLLSTGRASRAATLAKGVLCFVEKTRHVDLVWWVVVWSVDWIL